MSDRQADARAVVDLAIEAAREAAVENNLGVIVVVFNPDDPDEAANALSVASYVPAGWKPEVPHALVQAADACEEECRAAPPPDQRPS